MTLPCPHCRHPIAISPRVAGDRVWCSCNNWLMLAFHRNGAAYWVKVSAPVSYPREKR